MIQRSSVLVVAGICIVAATALAKNLESGQARVRDQKIASLRAQGPEGLDLALRTYDKLQAEAERLRAELSKFNLVESRVKSGAAAEIEQKITELESRLIRQRAAIDEIGGQRTCAVSRLYWYTDLAQAQAEATRTGRPILSLRMLGKLTDEFSCANSRFFRTSLYANKNISDYLRNHFVLHWQSVRPVPRVTIDFGDGRRLERTLTGNSAHYVLAADGTPLDVLPGLYSPHRFLDWLGMMQGLHAEYLAASETNRPALVKQYHLIRRGVLLERWDVDIQRLGESQVALVSTRIESARAAARRGGEDVGPDAPAPPAGKAAERAVSKGSFEGPMLRFANLGGRWMERGMDDDLWQAIAELHRDEVKLDEASVAVMRQEFPQARVAARLAISKLKQEDPILRLVRTFENSIGLDTIRNEYLLHRQIHERFVEAGPEAASIDSLNEWVYAELFLTPSSDPWLGLAPPDVYTALENDGRMEVSGSGSGTTRLAN